MLRKAAGWIGGALVVFAMAGFLFAWSGIYNIAASRGHWALVEWALEFGMSNSVKRRAWIIQPPPLDDPNLYILGAGHFHRACAHCHGAPGMKGDLTAQQALPPPPDLTQSSQNWKDNELFWIVKHGIKYTGMPAWVAIERDDEVWPIVAFLKKLPTLDNSAYRRLALGSIDPPAQAGHELAQVGNTSEAVGACARCHGAGHRGPASRLVPVLHGQPHEFLAASLRTYASGQRRSGIMQPVAAELDVDAIDKLAAYYSSLPPPKQSSSTAHSRAHALASEGDASAKIPACNGCHGNDALKIYPRLAGQNEPYMANRLRLWKHGPTSKTAHDAIMAPIARLLSDDQIAWLSAYFAGQP